MTVNPNLHAAAFFGRLPCRIIPYMAGNQNRRAFSRQYFREWRTHRGMTQAQVVGALELMGGDLPATAASLSRLENGKQPYSQPILEALADIYQAEPAALLERNPLKEGEVIDFWAALDERQRVQVMAIAKAVVSQT